jgi:hypothetical protein
MATSVLMTACGALGPSATGSMEVQANGGPGVGSGYGAYQAGLPTPGWGRQPGVGEPITGSTAGYGPGSPVGGMPGGAGWQPPGYGPLTTPPGNVRPGGIVPGDIPRPTGYLDVEQCVQNYMDGLRFVMAPTEEQLAGMRAAARQRCLTQGSAQGGPLQPQPGGAPVLQ